jgi:hypothetical protein
LHRFGFPSLLMASALSCEPRTREVPVAFEGGARAEPTAPLRAVAPDAAADAVVSAALSKPPPDPRLYVVGPSLDVLDAPRSSARVLGTVRAGGSLGLKPPLSGASADPLCKRGWAAAEPDGFVCESELTTRDGQDPAARTLGEYRLAMGAALPASYGISEDTAVYMRLPSSAEQLRAERGLARKKTTPTDRPPDAASPASSADVPADVMSGAFSPKGLRTAAPGSSVVAMLVAGTRVAWVAEVEDEGRRFVLTPDLLFVPRERVTPAIVSGFHGVEVTATEGVAFIGTKPEAKYKKEAESGRFVPSEDTWPAESAVFLVEPPNRFGEERFLPTAEPGVYLRVEHAIVAHPTPPSRWGVEGGARWIEINLRNNLLLLREGPAVKFATLASVGAVAPPRGKFRVFSKHLTFALPFERTRPGKAEAPDVLLVGEAPDSRMAFALYAAWWLYAWGAPNAAEGVALAPLDARRIFDWASPGLPDGWQSIRGEGTWVIVHD